jgi:uncharacterized protein
MSSKIEKVLTYKIIAIVGLSEDPARPSHIVAAYLMKNGYQIVPVRPDGEMILGEKVYRSLKDIPFKIEVVDVFRKSEYCVEIAQQAAAIGAKVLWLQRGIINYDAARIAHEAGMDVIMDRCMAEELKHQMSIEN